MSPGLAFAAAAIPALHTFLALAAQSDVTVVFLATGPAAITGCVAFLAARLQARTMIQQAESETERLRLQYAETWRKHRQDTYHEFAIVMYRLDGLVGRFEPFTKDSFAKWVLEFQTLFGGIDLYGSQAVRALAPPVRDALNSIGERARERGEDDFPEAFAHAYRAGRATLKSAVEIMIDAMRRDVVDDA